MEQDDKGEWGDVMFVPAGSLLNDKSKGDGKSSGLSAKSKKKVGAK